MRLAIAVYMTGPKFRIETTLEARRRCIISIPCQVTAAPYSAFTGNAARTSAPDASSSCWSLSSLWRDGIIG